MRFRWSWMVIGAMLLGAFILGHGLVAQQNPIARKLIQKILEERGLSPQDVREDPMLQQEIRERLEQLRQDPGWRDQVREMLAAQKRQEQKGNGYQAIVQKNLFKPLGSGDENRGPEFELQGTYIASNGSTKRALIFDFRANQLRDVQEGDRIRDARVVLIERRHVQLERGDTGETIDLRPSGNLFISTRGGGGGRGRPGRPGQGGSARQARGSSERGARPAMNPQQMRQRMQGRSPEEIRRMMQERMRQFRERRARAQIGARARPRGGGRGEQGERIIMDRP